jgi:hypothetical protein
MGSRYHLHSDRGGIFVFGGGVGFVFAQSDWVGVIGQDRCELSVEALRMASEQRGSVKGVSIIRIAAFNMRIRLTAMSYTKLGLKSACRARAIRTTTRRQTVS